jgi:hypothetical protein
MVIKIKSKTRRREEAAARKEIVRAVHVQPKKVDENVKIIVIIIKKLQ